MGAVDKRWQAAHTYPLLLTVTHTREKHPLVAAGTALLTGSFLHGTLRQISRVRLRHSYSFSSMRLA